LKGLKGILFAVCVLPALLLGAASSQPSFAAAPSTEGGPSTLNPQPATRNKLVANDADVDFALRCADSAIKQYDALPEAKKKRLETQIAKAAGVKDVATVSLTMRAMAAQVKTKSLATKENKVATKTFLNANPKWCGTVKAVRIGQQAMQKMGMKGEMSLDDMLNLIPE